MSGPDVLWVALAGSAGAGARYGVDRSVPRRGPFPSGTLIVNLTGSLLLGVLTGLVEFHQAAPLVTLVAGTGFCGGYTTFSTASFETVRLVQEGERARAAANVAASAGGAIAAAAAGLALASL